MLVNLQFIWYLDEWQWRETNQIVYIKVSHFEQTLNKIWKWHTSNSDVKMLLDKTPKRYSSCCNSSCRLVNGIFCRSTARNATRFPTYDANIPKQNNHHEVTIRRVDKALGCGEKPSKKEDSEDIHNSSINEIRETYTCRPVKSYVFILPLSKKLKDNTAFFK